MGVSVQEPSKYEPIPASYGVYIVTLVAILFQIVNQVTQKVGAPQAVDSKDVWKWRNLFISWIHAVIVGSWDLICLALYLPDILNDLIEYQNFFIYAMIAFSTGYFVHDFIDLAANGKLFSSWEIIAHHICVAGMFFYNLMTSRCIGYNVIALLCEVNTIFLHSRKLLQMCQFPFDHWLYRGASYLNLITFLCCRFVALTAIVAGMFIYPDRVPAMYFWALAAAMFVMWGINIILFWRLLRNDILRKYFTSDKKSHRKGSPLLSETESTSHLLDNNHSTYVDASTNNNKVYQNGTKPKYH